MHMADALLAPAVAATMYAASAVTVGASVKTLRKDENKAKLPTMAVASALVFAGQMINYTIPGTGSPSSVKNQRFLTDEGCSAMCVNFIISANSYCGNAALRLHLIRQPSAATFPSRGRLCFAKR